MTDVICADSGVGKVELCRGEAGLCDRKKAGAICDVEASCPARTDDRPLLAAQTSLPPVRLKKDVEKKKAS